MNQKWKLSSTHPHVVPDLFDFFPSVYFPRSYFIFKGENTSRAPCLLHMLNLRYCTRNHTLLELWMYMLSELNVFRYKNYRKATWRLSSDFALRASIAQNNQTAVRFIRLLWTGFLNELFKKTRYWFELSDKWIHWIHKRDY